MKINRFASEKQEEERRLSAGCGLNFLPLSGVTAATSRTRSVLPLWPQQSCAARGDEVCPQRKTCLLKTRWSNFCPSLQSADSLRSGNVATLVENRPDRTGAVNSRIIRQFENKSVHFKFSEGNSTSAAQFVLVNIHYG